MRGFLVHKINWHIEERMYNKEKCIYSLHTISMVSTAPQESPSARQVKRQPEYYAYVLEKLHGLKWRKISSEQAAGDDLSIHDADITLFEVMLNEMDERMVFNLDGFRQQVEYLKTYPRSQAIIQALVIKLELDNPSKTEEPSRIQRVYDVVPDINPWDGNIWLLLDYLYPGMLRHGSAMMRRESAKAELADALA